MEKVRDTQFRKFGLLLILLGIILGKFGLYDPVTQYMQNSFVRINYYAPLLCGIFFGSGTALLILGRRFFDIASLDSQTGRLTRPAIALSFCVAFPGIALAIAVQYILHH